MGSTLDQLRELHQDLSVRSLLHALIVLVAVASVAVVGVVLALLGVLPWIALPVVVVGVPALLYVAAIRVLDGGS